MVEPFSIATKRLDGEIALVSLSGNHEMERARGMLRSELRSVIESEPEAVVLDVSELEFAAADRSELVELVRGAIGEDAGTPFCLVSRKPRELTAELTYTSPEDAVADLLQRAQASGAGEARRRAAALAGALKFDAHHSGRIALVVTELAKNLVNHSQAGEIVITPLEEAGIEIVALDRGPGIENMPEALRDGYSSKGTTGTGLGAVSRVSDEFDIYSSPGQGTVVLARVMAAGSKSRENSHGVISVPIHGEPESGDGLAIAGTGACRRYLLVDGIGHGSAAKEAADKAIAVLREQRKSSLRELVQLMHEQLRETRGAALALVELDSVAARLRLVSVGNVSVALVSAEKKRTLGSSNGTVGHTLGRIRELEYELQGGPLLVMASDGLRTNWDLTSYPGLLDRDPSVIAAVLYRDFSRGRDDVLVFATRCVSSSSSEGGKR